METPSRHREDDCLAAARDLRRLGWTVERITIALGISESTAWRYLRASRRMAAEVVAESRDLASELGRDEP